MCEVTRINLLRRRSGHDQAVQHAEAWKKMWHVGCCTVSSIIGYSNAREAVLFALPKHAKASNLSSLNGISGLALADLRKAEFPVRN